MKKVIISAIILVISAIATYYLVFNKNTGNYSPSMTNNMETNTVIIKNFSFNPSVLTVKTGTKVTWINNDSVSHTITSDSGNLLNSGVIPSGSSFSFTFSDPATANYHCSIHPMMMGSVVVTN